MKTIIHIGQHKTATSSIQGYLKDNRECLAKHNGLYVPESIAGFKSANHMILSAFALDEDRYNISKINVLHDNNKNELEIKLKIDIDKIYKEASNNQCDKVIWSNEGLYHLDSVIEYARLAKLFSDHSTEIEVVCCFRDEKSSKEARIRAKERNDRDRPNTQKFKQRKIKWEKIIAKEQNRNVHRIDMDNYYDLPRKKKLLEEVFEKCTYFDYDPNDNINKFMEVIGCHGSTDNTKNYRLNDPRTAKLS